MQTFLINLDRSTDRLASADAQLRKAEIPYDRISAVDGSLLDQSGIAGLDQRKAAELFTSPLRVGEIGCYLSHMRAVEKIVALDLPFAMVLEDDFKFLETSIPTLKALEYVLDGNGIESWDVINLGNAARKIYHNLPSDALNETTAQLCRALYFPVTTTGLIWSQIGARRFLAQGAHIYEPVDGTLQRLLGLSGRGLAFRNPVISTIGATSTIGKTGVSEMVMKNPSLPYRAGRYGRALYRYVVGPERDKT